MEIVELAQAYGPSIEMHANDNHASTWLPGTEPVSVKLGGVLELIYLPNAAPDLAPHLETLDIRYATTGRASGIGTQSAVFGYRERRPIRGEFCSPCALNANHPEVYRELELNAARAQAALTHYYEEKAHWQITLVNRQVLPDWKMGGTCFTGGIVNRNYVIPYHYDRANFNGAWSAQFTYHKEMHGGALVFPQLRLRLALGDRSLLLFNGKRWQHGVTPIAFTGAGYRYSVVYYPMAGMAQCLPPDEEIAYAQRKRTEREMRRAGVSDQQRMEI